MQLDAYLYFIDRGQSAATARACIVCGRQSRDSVRERVPYDSAVTGAALGLTSLSAGMAASWCWEAGTGGGGGIGGHGGGGQGGDPGNSGQGPPRTLELAFSFSRKKDAAEEDEMEEVEEEVEDEETFDPSSVLHPSSSLYDSEGLSSPDKEAFPGAHTCPAVFECAGVEVAGLPGGWNRPRSSDVLAGTACGRGMTCSRNLLTEDVRALEATGLFEEVGARVEALPLWKSALRGFGSRRAHRVIYTLREKVNPPLRSLSVRGAEGLPADVVKALQRSLLGTPSGKSAGGGEVSAAPSSSAPFGMSTMLAIRGAIEGWYARGGYGLCYIQHFSGMDTGDVSVEVQECRTRALKVVEMDDQGQPLGRLASLELERAVEDVLELRPKALYSLADARRSLQNVYALELFDNVQLLPRQDPSNPGAVDVDVLVHPRQGSTAELEAEWALALDARAGLSGAVPSAAALVPGGTVTWERRGWGSSPLTSVSASVNAKSFLSPGEDLSYRLTASQPYVWGLRDPCRTKLAATAFNSRKQSPAFMAPAGGAGDDVPPVWVDRAGAKVGLQQQLGRRSSAGLALMAQQVSALGEAGEPCPRGSRVLPSGRLAQDGPPCTVSASGTDRMVLAQAFAMRDATRSVAGTRLGSRQSFTVEQGVVLDLEGREGAVKASPASTSAFGSFSSAAASLARHVQPFNKCVLASTHFLPLLPSSPASQRGPPSLVLHGSVGAALGALPSYEAFLLGGPHSVRGFALGELSVCRRFAEAAAEVRLPLAPGRDLFAFAEAGTDGGSGDEVRGRPTEYYRRMGAGSAVGAGVKLHGLRVEAVRDSGLGRWNVMVHYGERF
ncbi:hypothetical protein H632_c282p2 [Helicosporidium sp. ATCC 50920]|nr:hypothetical protein H632_c282p2 [Helicosporidium sp. ATCC 50920]|eukprot:KDD76290.1 hypothetical protein H632_c282p2 [Helicosporidium sp. ATCC 50920]